MKVTMPYILGPTSWTDEAVLRADGTDGQKAQGSDSTLTDPEVLTQSATTSQHLIGTSTGTVTFAGVTLTPHLVIVQAGPLNPTMGMLRDAATANGAPTFNYFRSRAGGAVNNGDILGIFSANGHDGTDFAAGGEIDIVVDEADTGTAAVGSNQMGSKLRLRTSRRGASAPAFGLQVRHNGAVQLNNAITLVPITTAVGMGASFEADTKVLYYIPEDTARGVIAAKYIMAPTGTNTLATDTSENALFDDVTTNGRLTIPTGTYFFSCLLSISGMDAGAASNCAFDILGAGSATVANVLYMNDGMEIAINTASANTASMSNAAQTPASLIIGAASGNIQVRIWGLFRITAAGTIVPSVTMAVNGNPIRSANSFFYCECWGSSIMQSVGNWD